MLNKDEILRKLRENRERTEKYGAGRIGLFGSYVKNEQKEGSDVDLLVEFEEDKKTFDNYMELKFFLEDLLGQKTDLVISDALKSRLKHYIMDEVEYAT